MPKIVDRVAYRAELANRAAALFSEHGYSGLGMRAIAEALGLSKSALYHYFPSKRDLFIACTEAVTTWPGEQDRPGPASETAPAYTLLALADELRPVFAREMSLLFDYLRGMDPTTIAADPAMRLALDRFTARAGEIAGPGPARAALAAIMGALMLDHFSGGRWPARDFLPLFEAVTRPA